MTTLSLATPVAIRDVLSLLGISWIPVAVRDRPEASHLPTDPGLYIWVVPRADQEPLTAGGIYAGIGDGAQGLRGRLLTEFDHAEGVAFHGHGIAVRRTGAVAVAGALAWLPNADLTWIDRGNDELHAWSWRPLRWQEDWDVTIRRRLSDRHDSVVRVAENVAIRAAVYLGDVGFPVNSRMAGAWGSSYGSNDKGWEDGAAWAAVTHLIGATQSLPGGEDGLGPED